MLHNMASHLHQASTVVLSTVVQQPWIASATLACGLVAYYCISVVKVPELVSKPSSAWTEFLLRHVPVIKERFWCSAWCYEARAQTIAATVLNAGLAPLKYNREIIQLSDGGQLCLDWIKEENPDRNTSSSSSRANPSTGTSNDSSLVANENIETTSRCGCHTKPQESGQMELRNGFSPTKSKKTLDGVETSVKACLNPCITGPVSSLKDVTDLSNSEDSGCGSDQSSSSCNDCGSSNNDCGSSNNPCGQTKTVDLSCDSKSSSISPPPLRPHSRDLSSPEEDSHESTFSEQSGDPRSPCTSSELGKSGRSQNEACRSQHTNADTKPLPPGASSINSKSEEPSESVGLDPDNNFPVTDQPLLVVLPGLTGSSESEYVKDFVRAGQASGYKCLVFNNRGKGGVTLKTPRTYCAANCDDFAEAIEQIVARYRRERERYRQQQSTTTSLSQQSNDVSSTDDKGQDEEFGKREERKQGGSAGERYKNDSPMIVAVGISLGGMIVCHYLSDRPTQAAQRLTAAVGVSVPYNVFLGTDSLEKPLLNLALNRHLAKCLVDSVVELKYMLQDSDKWDYDNVLKARTIRQFDARFTSVQFGYEDVNAYYTSASLHNKMHRVRVPYLGLSAADDPFQPREGLPALSALESDHVALCVTSRGGHIGFLEGLLGHCWSARLIQQLLTAVVEQPEVMKKIKLGQQ